MGTNYYLRENICVHCKRSDYQKHICKSSAGWQIYFHGSEEWDSPTLRTWQEWKAYLAQIVEIEGTGAIFDEYDRTGTLSDLIAMVESPERAKMQNHYDECVKKGYGTKDQWKDPEGYSFSSREFS